MKEKERTKISEVVYERREEGKKGGKELGGKDGRKEKIKGRKGERDERGRAKARRKEGKRQDR